MSGLPYGCSHRLFIVPVTAPTAAGSTSSVISTATAEFQTGVAINHFNFVGIGRIYQRAHLHSHDSGGRHFIFFLHLLSASYVDCRCKVTSFFSFRHLFSIFFSLFLKITLKRLEKTDKNKENNQKQLVFICFVGFQLFFKDALAYR